MTRFVIHVGPHKTGSSYLQAGFAGLRPSLAEHGIHYPKLWGPITHHRLIRELSAALPNAALEKEFQDLHAARHRVVLISVEGLTGLSEPRVAYLRKLLGDAEARIVFYARSWAGILPSHWKEEIKAGRTVVTFPEYIDRQLLNPHVSGLVNFGGGLRTHATIFGMDAISIVSYDHLKRSSVDLLQHFLSTFLGIEDTGTFDNQPRNVSHGAVETEIIRALNALERHRRGEPAPLKYAIALRNRYLARSADLRESTLVRTAEQYIDNLHINEATKALLELHRDLFEEFQQCLVAPHQARAFFAPRRVAVPYVRSDYLLVPGVADELAALHADLTSAMAPGA